MKTPTILGIACGIGAEKLGAQLGVWDMYYSLPKIGFHMEKVIYTDDLSRKLEALDTWQNITQQTQKFIEENTDINNYQSDTHLFITGDHSNGFCVWNSMLTKYKGDLGLIWIDAHLDAHTLRSSDSKNIHGMPTSHLLGKGDSQVAQENKYPLNPKNLCFIGTRDYEKAEIDFLENLGVKIYFMKDITQDNLDGIIKEAIEYVSRDVNNFGISIDMDCFDPVEVPGTGCFCPDGLWVNEATNSLKNINSNPQFIGLELSEFDPSKDKDNKTKNTMLGLVQSVFGLEN